MFAMLQDADRGTLLEVSYHVGQRFFERHHFMDAEARRSRIVAAFGPEVDAKLLDLIETVIAEIEEREGVAFAEMTEARIRPYQNALRKMREDRQPPHKPLSADALRRIEEFRREYGLGPFQQGSVAA